MRAAPEIKRVIVAIHEIGGVIRTFDECAVVHAEARSGELATTGRLLHEKSS
ncbi:MAG: hypothetical protein U1F83_04195 [Verrucomicrobiota bacterium]